MAGHTFKWLGGSGTITALADWQVEQNGTFTPASTLPGAGDTLLLDSGTIIDSSVNFDANTLDLLGSGVMLQATGVTFDAASEILAGAGAGASVLVDTVDNDGTLAATAAGAALYLKLAGDMTNAGLLTAAGGSVLNVSNLGGALANSGTVQVHAARSHRAGELYCRCQRRLAECAVFRSASGVECQCRNL
jgi:hypothetical protein